MQGNNTVRQCPVITVNLPHFIVLLDAHDLPLKSLIICPLLQTLKLVQMSNPVVSNLQKEDGPRLKSRVGNINGGKFGSVIPTSELHFPCNMNI